MTERTTVRRTQSSVLLCPSELLIVQVFCGDSVQDTYKYILDLDKGSSQYFIIIVLGMLGTVEVREAKCPKVKGVGSES